MAGVYIKDLMQIEEQWCTCIQWYHLYKMQAPLTAEAPAPQVRVYN